jgi:hypothetical protein
MDACQLQQRRRSSATQQAAEDAAALSSSPQTKLTRMLLAGAGVGVLMVQVVYITLLQWLMKDVCCKRELLSIVAVNLSLHVLGPRSVVSLIRQEGILGLLVCIWKEGYMVGCIR